MNKFCETLTLVFVTMVILFAFFIGIFMIGHMVGTIIDISQEITNDEYLQIKEMTKKSEDIKMHAKWDMQDGSIDRREFNNLVNRYKAEQFVGDL